MRVVALVALLALPLAAQTPFLAAPSQNRSFTEHLLGKQPFIRSGISAGFTYLNNNPHEWGQGPDGLGKRFASSFGRHLIRSSVQYGMAETFRQDLRYHPSGKDGFGGRLKHAMTSTFVARNIDTGDPTFASARIVGIFAAGFVSRTWMPDRLQTAGSGFRTSGISIGLDVGFNVLREFLPDIRGKRRTPPTTP